jgi:hypothetical protein
MQQTTDKYQTSTGMWTVECGEYCEIFEKKELIFPYLSGLVKKLTNGRIDVDEDIGGRSWFSKFIFGMNPRIIQMHFTLEWYEDTASLIFFDGAGSEYRVKDSEFLIEPTEEIRNKIAHGEPKPYPIEECLSLQRALKAIEEYLKSGERPDWINYVYVA